MRFRIPAIIASLAIIAPATAQAANGRPELDVVIETLDVHATKCGITRDNLYAPAVNTLRRNGIDVSSDSQAVLYINANILNFEGRGCVYNLDIQIYSVSLPILRYGFKARRFETVELCNKGMIVSGSVSGVSTSIFTDTEQLIGKCLADLIY
jgi:hypothetical protein